MLTLLIGTLVGIYATNNNGTGQTTSDWTRWRYKPVAQEVDEREFVDVTY